jgi:hypothetical protein
MATTSHRHCPDIVVSRFKAPQPPEAWRGTRDATVEGSVCPQQDVVSGTFMGDEDCLFLNVFMNKVTQLPRDGLTDSLRKSTHVFHLEYLKKR